MGLWTLPEPKRINNEIRMLRRLLCENTVMLSFVVSEGREVDLMVIGFVPSVRTSDYDRFTCVSLQCVE